MDYRKTLYNYWIGGFKIVTDPGSNIRVETVQVQVFFGFSVGISAMKRSIFLSQASP